MKYLHADLLGSVRAVSSPSGTIAQEYDYDEYGNALGTDKQHAISKFGYAGEYFDGDLGFYYLRARWYDPATAQFTSVDPLLIFTHTPYGYASGNPLLYTDPSGLVTGGGCIGAQVISLVGWSFEACIAMGVDKNGTLTFGGSYTHAGFDIKNTVIEGTPSIGVSAVGQFSNAEQVKDLAGYSYTVGISRGKYTENIFFAPEALCGDPDAVVGRELGVTAGFPSTEIHGGRTTTVAWQSPFTWNPKDGFLPPFVPIDWV